MHAGGGKRNRGLFASAVSCLLLIIIGVTLWFASRPSFDEREIKSARLALAVNDVLKAATHTANAIEYNPTSIAVRNCEADLMLAQGNTKRQQVFTDNWLKIRKRLIGRI